MENIKKRLIFSFVINILSILFFISCIINNIVRINNDPNNIYGNVWGLFRYFTIDGNLLSFIFNIIIFIIQIKALRLSESGNIQDKIVSNFLYIISLISACNEIIIFIVVVLVFLPMSTEEWVIGLIGTYKASSLHLSIPVLLTFRFLFLDSRKRDLKILEKFIGGLPMLVYGTIMYILCGTKVFTSFDRTQGDGRIPYPFFDLYHQTWYFCLFIALFIFVFGFGISILFDFLNKKCEKLVWPYEFNRDSDIENNFNKENEIEPNSNE
jgi:hypothetical protein